MPSVLDRAQNFSGGPVAAARQRDRWARQEANATDEETREQLREAIADLEAHYPDLEDLPIGGAEAFARERGHGTGARSPVHEGRRRAASPKAQAGARAAKKPASSAPPAGQGQPRPVPGLTPGARRSTSQRSAAGGQPTPRVDRAIQQTGIPSATGQTTSTVMAALGVTVGLSLLYLVLSSAERPGNGASAMPRAINGVTSALERFVNSKKDIFPSAQAAVPSEGPIYNEARGGDIAVAAARLKAAGRRPRRPATRAQRRERERRPQGHMHR